MMRDNPSLPQFGAYDTLKCISDNWGTQYFRVRNRALDRLETVIVLKPRIGVNPDVATAFLTKYRTLAGINHPNIARVYDVGIFEKNLHFTALEHVKGTSLDELVAGQNAPSISSITSWATQLADAIDTLSKYKIYPMQLGLKDIIITNDGQAILVDLQTSQLSNLDLRRPACPCPEQSIGKLDVRCGIYNLGIILYELVTGMIFHLESERRYAAELPDNLINIIEKCLHIDPAKRFQNGKDLVKALSSNSAHNARSRFPLQTATVTAGFIAVFLMYSFFIYRDTAPLPADSHSMVEMMLPVSDSIATPPRVIRMLLRHNTFQSIISQLSTERDKGHLAFGRKNDFLDPDKCFIFIFGTSEGILTTALAPGKEIRINLLTNKPVKYTEEFLLNKAAIWILPTD